MYISFVVSKKYIYIFKCKWRMNLTINKKFIFLFFENSVFPFYSFLLKFQFRRDDFSKFQFVVVFIFCNNLFISFSYKIL